MQDKTLWFIAKVFAMILLILIIVTFFCYFNSISHYKQFKFDSDEKIVRAQESCRNWCNTNNKTLYCNSDFLVNINKDNKSYSGNTYCWDEPINVDCENINCE